MVLVDTNVVAHLLLAGEPGASARALHGLDADWRSEPLMLYELTNVMATSVRARGVTREKALGALRHAQQMFEGALLPISDQEALGVAARFGISGYDARFVAAAMALGSRLVTEDARLRKCAPAWTRSMAEALADLGAAE